MPSVHLAVLPALCLVTGCVVSIPTTPGAERVAMTHKEADVTNCHLLGEVFGLTESNYVRDERREMQNETVDLGGDTLLITKEKDTPRGLAYRCEAAPATGTPAPAAPR
jgi:hypothetical protein